MRLRSKRIVIGVAIAVVAAAIVVVNLRYRRSRGPSVEVESIEKRDLVALVSASGKIQPKRLVNISADTIGRVTSLTVEEGDAVKAGQFLLQIDPEIFASAVQRGEAGLQAAREALKQAKVSVEASRANLELAHQNLKRKRELFKDDFVSREVLDQVESEVKVREADLESREAEVLAQEQRLQQQVAELRTARHNLSKVMIDAPMDGIVSRLNIEEGETVLVGTMNNPGTVLMTVADMSVVQAELEVDETDIVDIRLGQTATVVIDAFPDKEFKGTVTKIGASSMQPTSALDTSSRQATNFEVEVTLEGQIPSARPGFSCTADITAATREKALAVPIQALTVREVTRNGEGLIVRNQEEAKKKPSAGSAGNDSDLPPGHTRKEEEGVFVVRNGKAEFVPIEVGIAGEKHFEVLTGLAVGDQVITGPFASVRELKDGDSVRIEKPAK